MAHNSDNLRLSSASNLTVKTLNQVKSTSPELPSPSFISNAVVPESGSSEGREGVDCVTNETSSSVGVHAQEERDK